MAGAPRSVGVCVGDSVVGGPVLSTDRVEPDDVCRTVCGRGGDPGGSVRSDPGGHAGARHREGPATFVHQMVVRLTERQQILEVRLPAVTRPPADVMDPTRIERNLAGGMPTCAMHGSEGATLFTRDRAGGSSCVEDLSVTAENRRVHRG